MAVPPDFVSGQVLTAAQMNKIGAWLVKSQTIGSAVSSVQVTNAFSADYENYRIMVVGGVASTNNNLILTLGSTTTGYYKFALFGAYNASTVNGANTSNGTGWPDMVQGATDGFYGDFRIIKPFLTARTGIAGETSTFRANGLYITQGGFLDNATSYTDFTLTTSTGTITGGTIYVYGLRD